MQPSSTPFRKAATAAEIGAAARTGTRSWWSSLRFYWLRVATTGVACYKHEPLGHIVEIYFSLGRTYLSASIDEERNIYHTQDQSPTPHQHPAHLSRWDTKPKVRTSTIIHKILSANLMPQVISRRVPTFSRYFDLSPRQTRRSI